MSAAHIAARRRTDPRSLSVVLRRDLDWVVMKCLEKDRARRYETANGLAMELRRYLNSEPVLAGPPSAAYRLRKFAGKHRAPVTVAAANVSAKAVMIATRENDVRIVNSFVMEPMRRWSLMFLK